MHLSEMALLNLKQRWMELPVMAIGSFLIRYVSNCQLSSTYENISFTLISRPIPLRHNAQNYYETCKVCLRGVLAQVSGYLAYNRTANLTFTV